MAWRGLRWVPRQEPWRAGDHREWEGRGGNRQEAKKRNPYTGFQQVALLEGDVGSMPGSRISPGGGSGNPFQYSCLENPMDRGTWGAMVHRVTKSQT